MKLSIILATLSATFGAVQAADVCRPTGSDCFGNAVCCNDIQEGKCCNLGAATTRIKMKVPANRYAETPFLFPPSIASTYHNLVSIH
jgi:hypothetical protein